MDKYLNTPIKEVIIKFPPMGKILENYNIGCVPCTLGSCLLKEIVAIHHLSEDQEREMMYQIEKVIYPEREIKKPLKQIIEKETPKEITYSPPIQRLVNEHVLIKKWIACIPQVIENLDLKSKFSRQLILESLDFIRFYADEFHHAKEEQILFAYTDKNLDIIKTMFREHEIARDLVKTIAEAMKTNDSDAIVENLRTYQNILTEHIKKEDEILYPWIDRGLSITQVGELFAKFDEAEEKMDQERVEKCKKFAQEIEQRIQKINQEEKGK